jgi:cytochrome c oxidase subunit 4
MTGEAEHAADSGRLFVFVWLWLLGITGVELLLAYQHLGVTLMLITLMGLSVIKAYLIISYFMHLRYEKPSLAVTLIPPLVAVICLLFIIFPDSIRLLHLRPR